jgi:hypothetical protein
MSRGVALKKSRVGLSSSATTADSDLDAPHSSYFAIFARTFIVRKSVAISRRFAIAWAV